MNKPESQTTFNQKFPETGVISHNVKLTAEQASQFGSIISGKVFELARKAELNNVEKTFIDRTLDLGARTIVYASERQGLAMVDGHSAQATAASVANLRGLKHIPVDHLVNNLGGITGGAYSVRLTPELRTTIEDAAGYSMQLFGQMAERAGGVEVDNYLEGNLKDIVANFEKLEQY